MPGPIRGRVPAVAVPSTAPNATTPEPRPPPPPRSDVDAFAGVPSPSGSVAPSAAPASTNPDPVLRFSEDLVQALAQGKDPHVATRLPVETLVAFAKRAVEEGRALATSSPGEAQATTDRLVAELVRLRQGVAGEHMTALGLDVLRLIIEHASVVPPETAKVDPTTAATPREQLEAWLVLAAQGKQVRGGAVGEWYAPYVIGTTEVPRSTEVVNEGIGSLIARMSGADGSRAEKFWTGREALDAVKARTQSGGALNIITWGQSAGGPAAAELAGKLEREPGVTVRRVVMLDPVNVLRLPPALPANAETLSFHLGGVSFFEIGPGWKRWHIDEGEGRHAERVKNTDHFAMVGDLYDRGILQLAIGQELLQDR